MSNRITRKHLETLVSNIAKAKGLPAKAYIKESRDAQVGALCLDYAACYGGYSLHQIINTGGGITVINRSCRERMPAQQMAAFLHGLIAAEDRF